MRKSKRALAAMPGLRAPALVLGLFLCTIFSLGADEGLSLLAESGTLWIGDDGGSGYWRSGLLFRTENQFYTDINLGQVFSSLPIADGSIFGFRWNTGFDTKWAGLEFNSGFFNHSYLSSDTEDFSFYTKHGAGTFFGLKAPLHFGNFDLAPSLLYGAGSSDEGSFYWFFGKPDIPSLSILGLSLGYRKQHTLDFHYLSLDAEILSNEEKPLFAFGADAYLMNYTFTLETKKTRFWGSLGWLYASADIDGALTSSNQPYLFFLYLSYNVTGSLSAHAGFGAVSVEQTFSIFQYHITLGAAHFFRDEGSAEIHYKKKQLFGGDEAFEYYSLNLEGAGAAFLLLDAGVPALRVGRAKKTLLSLGLRKLFAVPWGYEDILPPSDSARSDGGPASLVRTLLLSGLSLNCSLKF
jgi:hypothetical protein